MEAMDTGWYFKSILTAIGNLKLHFSNVINAIPMETKVADVPMMP